ncbi:MAG: hypothetical protein EOP04_09340 [Proteobacteria bacterium]|nr:MAG: hypothetical protein EOP04_09340 [Pseudomonadota bacterium]
MKKHLAFGLVSLGFLAPLAFGLDQGVPKAVATVLPTEFLTEENKDVAEFILSFSVHEDSLNPAKYYYEPGFHPVVQNSASILVNKRQIDRADEVSKISAKMTKMATEEWATISGQYSAIGERVTSALEAQNPDLAQIKLLQNIQVELKAEYDRLMSSATTKENLLPAGIRDEFYTRMSDVFGTAGFPTSLEDVKDTKSRTTNLSRLSKSNAGMLTANIYGGLTAKERELFRRYKELRKAAGLQDLTVAVIPAKNFEWKSLAETVKNPKDEATLGIPIARDISGAGNLTAATVNIDLTVDGAAVFAQTPPPVILPVYVKADTLQKYPTFTARVKCDFSNGWKLNGRTDVRDGLVIYNNDITTSMVSESINQTNEPCSVTTTGGGGDAVREAAIRKSVDTIRERLEGIYLDRVNTSYQDRMKYWESVQNDIAANRRPHLFGALGSIVSSVASSAGSLLGGSFGGLISTAAGYLQSGFGGLFTRGISQATNFYWHTNKQNIKHIDQVNFESVIVEDGNSWVQVELAPQICLAYNPSTKLYNGCSEDESKQAKTLQEARETVEKSPECRRADSPSDCGSAREETAPRDPSTGNVTVPAGERVIELPDEL